MTIEYSIPRSTKVVFEEAKPYSYVVTPINLIDKIFENYNKYDIKTLTLKLLDSAVNPDFLSKK